MQRGMLKINMEGDMMKKYFIILGIVSFLFITLGATYAFFYANVDIGQFVEMSASNVPVNSSSQGYERIVLESNESKTIDLNITNDTESSLYYGVWYEMVDPSTISNDITIAKDSNSVNPTVGQLTSEQSKVVSLYVENNTNADIVFYIGTAYSSTNELNLPTGRNIITAVTS